MVETKHLYFSFDDSTVLTTPFDDGSYDENNDDDDDDVDEHNDDDNTNESIERLDTSYKQKYVKFVFY